MVTVTPSVKVVPFQLMMDTVRTPVVDGVYSFIDMDMK